jgi:fatty acid desaturase
MNGQSDQRDELRLKAEKHVDAVIGFRQHLLVYVIVNTFLILIWLVVALIAGGGSWFPWFIFPLAGWGIGLIMHAWGVFGQSEDKREKLVQRQVEKMRTKNNP